MPPNKSDGPDSSGDENKLVKAIMKLMSEPIHSTEKKSKNPMESAKTIALKASLKSAAISGGLALPPGPLGMATILPDLVAIWHIQRQMVADIAQVFGKEAALSREAMIYCLFRHGSAMVVRDIIVRVGERLLFRRASVRVLQQILSKIGVRLTQRVIGKGISRWVPVVGALAIAGYGYYDTNQVAITAIDVFSRDVGLEGEDPQGAAA